MKIRNPRLKEIESIISSALDDAVSKWTRQSGSFIPFAKRIIIGALRDYGKARNVNRVPLKTYREYTIDVDALRRGIIAMESKIDTSGFDSNSK